MSAIPYGVRLETHMPVRRDTRRRFEQFVRNPDCEANVISAVTGVDMAKVAEAEGGEPTMGQSPFALARGTQFENALFRENGKRIREALIEAGVVDAPAQGFLDLRLRLTGGPIRDLDTAVKGTHELLRRIGEPSSSAERRQLPSIIAGAALRVPGQPVMLPEGVVALDVLTVSWPASHAGAELRIGEIKTYADRAGYTDKGDLAAARAQAGVYRYALGLVLEDEALQEVVECHGRGFLVLSRAGSNEPSIRSDEDLEFLTARARRGFERLRNAAKTVSPFDPTNEEKGIAAVTSADTTYSEKCLQFCDRAAHCREKAGIDDGAALGDDVRRFLAGTTVTRAIELLHGSDPKNDVEHDLVRRFRSAHETP